MGNLYFTARNEIASTSVRSDKPRGRISDSGESTERELTLAFPRRHRLRGFYGNIFSSYEDFLFNAGSVSLLLLGAPSSNPSRPLIALPYVNIYFHLPNCSMPIEVAGPFRRPRRRRRLVLRLLMFVNVNVIDNLKSPSLNERKNNFSITFAFVICFISLPNGRCRRNLDTEIECQVNTNDYNCTADRISLEFVTLALFLFI